MVALDPRVNPFRPELAASHLKGQVEALTFVDGTTYEIVEPQTPLRRSPSPEASVDTEALLGERVTIYETTDEGWAWGQLVSDGYVGWMSSNAFAPMGAEPTHKVAVPRSLGFPRADIKTPPLATLPLGSRLSVVRMDEKFATTAGGLFVPLAHLAPLKDGSADFVDVAEWFTSVPYLWGGKTTLGIDCSGLVQVALTAAGISCPRDSDMQELALGQQAAVTDLRRGDLVFWKGHVAIALDKDTLIHANAHHMMVASEPAAEAIARIKAAGSDVTSVRRL